MKIESVTIDKLMLDPSNARKHEAKNLEAIKGSLAKFGQQKPIVVGKNGVVIAGNGTLEAARSLGWDKLDIVRTKLEGSDATAFALADNRTSELAVWDDEILNSTLKALEADGFDIGAIGFDDFDFSVPPKEGLTDPDELPTHVEPRTKPSDLYVCGRHRVLCGDATNVLDVERLMGGEKVEFVFTDPPYGMKLDTDWSKGMTLSGGKPMKGAHSKLGHKDLRHDRVIGDNNDFSPDLIQSIVAVGCDETFIWGADYFSEHLPKKTAGSWIVWDKRYAADGPIKQAMSTSEFELCWSREKHQRLICRMVHSGICSVENDKRVHPTQKPVKLAEWFFDHWADGRKNVLDLFLGSGSTLIACEKTGRRCFGMEIDPHYVDVIVERWERFTGEKSQLQSLEEALGS